MSVRRMLCVAAVCAGLSIPGAAVAGGAVTVEVDGEAIALKAEDVLLRQVLVELSEFVPFELVERGEALEQPFSFDFEASSWAYAFHELLRGEGYALTTDEVTGQPEMLVVDWDVVGESLGLARSGAGAGGGDVEARIRAEAERLLKPRDEVAEAIAAVDEARQALQQARHALLAGGGHDHDTAGGHDHDTAGGHDDHDHDHAGDHVAALEEAADDALIAYDEALGKLGNHDDQRAVTALVPALDDVDESSRRSALEALRWQSNAVRNPEAVGRVAAVIETESDPELQRAALEVYVRYGDPDAVLKTIEPIALSEGPNQDLAVREWLRIRKEQEAQGRTEQ